MKVLVTGGCGFIGSNLVDLLLNKGHSVLVLDNLSTGRLENISHHLQNDKLSFAQADICDEQQISEYFQGVDWVFHLAGLADIVPSIERPVKYFSVNVTGTLNVLQCSRENNVKRFIYAASSSCYGIPSIYPTPEEAAISPQYPYALTKYMGEELVLHWSKTYKLPALSLRLFNVYGLRSRTTGAYGAVFGVFLAQKINEKPMTVVGDGSQTRDFTFVTDVVNAFLAAAESALSGEAMNVGSGNSYSIKYLVQLLQGDVVHIPKRPGEPDCTFGDISKIQKLLAWSPNINFEDGVRIMTEQIDLWKEAPVWDKSSIENATKIWFKCLDN